MGEIIAVSVYDYLQSDFGRETVDDLVALGLKVDQETSETESLGDQLRGKTFVVTGTLSRYTRDEIKQLILQHGGKTSSSRISGKTDYLIAGEKAPVQQESQGRIAGCCDFGRTRFSRFVGGSPIGPYGPGRPCSAQGVLRRNRMRKPSRETERRGILNPVKDTVQSGGNWTRRSVSTLIESAHWPVRTSLSSAGRENASVCPASGSASIAQSERLSGGDCRPTWSHRRSLPSCPDWRRVRFSSSRIASRQHEFNLRVDTSHVNLLRPVGADLHTDLLRFAMGMLFARP